MLHFDTKMPIRRPMIIAVLYIASIRLKYVSFSTFIDSSNTIKTAIKTWTIRLCWAFMTFTDHDSKMYPYAIPR